MKCWSVKGGREDVRHGSRRGVGALIGAAALFAAFPAPAQTAAPGGETPAPAQAEAGGLWTRDKLLGDMGGLRPFLEKHGVSLGLSETDELWANVSGGLHRGARYEGITLMTLNIDTKKAFGLPGGTFYADALQIHGRSITAENLAVLEPASSLEADPATRLWEIWYEQEAPGGLLALKLGQQSVDTEYMVADYAGVFLNATWGWMTVPTDDLFASGPVYPLSSLGVRLKLHPIEPLTILAGVYDDNPPGGPFDDDPQLRDGEASGTLFNLNTGALWLWELQVAVNQSPSKGCNNVTCGLPVTFKIGGYYDTAAFPGQRFDTLGLSLANPLSNGIAREERGNFGIYGLVNQMIWRAGPDNPRSIGAFLRLIGAPSDRNLVSFAFDLGATLKAPFAGRDNDTFAIGYSFAKISRAASDFDRDTAFFTGAPFPVRSNESFIEVTYQAQLVPWWQLQPDFQYFFRPGGGVPNPANPSARIGDEAVFALRSVITF
jgi:porin